MSTISSTGTLTQNPTNYAFIYTPTGGSPTSITSWPVTISAGVTVTFGSDLTLTTTSQYFIIGGSGVTIDGAGYVVNVPANYTGLVQNGNSSTNGYSNCLLENIGIEQTGTIYNGVAQDYFGKGNTSCSITNCYVIVGTVSTSPSSSSLYGGGIAGQRNTASISKCYVICTTLGGFSPGIAGDNNSGTISNCYVICGGNIPNGIAGSTNSGAISNCYVICGGNISYTGGGIAGSTNSGTISNCYVICGGNINIDPMSGGGGGIAGPTNSAAISNCYVIIGGSIGSGAGGIAGKNNGGTISDCYVNYSSLSGSGYAIASTTNGGSGNSSDANPYWTPTGAGKLLSSAWTNYDSTKPWLLSAFNTAIASSTTTSTASGSILLNTYGQSFLNGTVYSGQQTATFNYYYGSNITYSALSTGTTYTLGLYAYDLLSNLTAIAFTFTNDSAIKTAFNYTGSTAEDIVPYTYSVTNNVSLTYSASVDCFLEGTKILTDKGYVNIEKLSKNDLIVTPEGNKNIYKLGKCSIVNLGVQERIKDQLYICTSDNYKEITEDLVMTGCHSVLVDSFASHQQAKDTVDLLKKLYITGNKLRLPVCLDERARVYEEKGEKTVYHIALENNHYDANYGIYANGLLVESCSMNYIDNKSKNLVCIDI